MKFDLVFENSNDKIPFSVIKNHKLFTLFVNKITESGSNRFLMNNSWQQQVNGWVNEIQNNVAYINSYSEALGFDPLPAADKLTSVLDQDYLNKLHSDWVASQQVINHIDDLRRSQSFYQKNLGDMLHHQTPDSIRKLTLAEVFSKIAAIRNYERINIAIHDVESAFNNQDCYFYNNKRYEMIDNTVDTEFTNDRTNFNFGNTYLGRQLYDKWKNYDTELQYPDHYNYKQLEQSFNINFERTETLPFSKEFVQWCSKHNVTPVSTQVPVANIDNLEENLTEYRSILYSNLEENNYARINITED